MKYILTFLLCINLASAAMMKKESYLTWFLEKQRSTSHGYLCTYILKGTEMKALMLSKFKCKTIILLDREGGVV